MIRKIIKNRQQIVEGVAMVATLYVLIVMHNLRLAYAKDTRTYRNY